MTYTRLRFKKDNKKAIIDCYLRKGSFHCGDLKLLVDNKLMNSDSFNLSEISQDLAEIYRLDSTNIESGASLYKELNANHFLDAFIALDRDKLDELIIKKDALLCEVAEAHKIFYCDLIKQLEKRKYVTNIYRIKTISEILAFSPLELYNRSKTPRDFRYCASPAANIIFSMDGKCYVNETKLIKSIKEFETVLDIQKEIEKINKKLDDINETSRFKTFESIAEYLKLTIDDIKNTFFMSKLERESFIKIHIEKESRDNKLILDKLINKYKIVTIK